MKKVEEDSYDNTLKGLGEMTYAEFLVAQDALRAKGRPVIPYIDMSSRQGYPAAMEMVKLVQSYGLEGNPNVGLGGVTAFVDDKEHFASLQRLISEHPELTVKLPKMS